MKTIYNNSNYGTLRSYCSTHTMNKHFFSLLINLLLVLPTFFFVSIHINIINAKVTCLKCYMRTKVDVLIRGYHDMYKMNDE